MSKKQIILIVSIAIAVGIALFVTPNRRNVVNLGGGQFITTVCQTADATTTRRFLITGNASSTLGAGVFATSTPACVVDSGDVLDLNLMTEGSTTAAVFRWTYEFSTNGIDYFPEDGIIVEGSSNTTHGQAPVMHSWTPGTAATTTRNIAVGTNAARFMRVNFTVSGANGSFWAAIVSREQSRR